MISFINNIVFSKKYLVKIKIIYLKEKFKYL